MKYAKLILIISIIGCGTQRNTIELNSLSSIQIKSDGPGSGEPGKCYQRMKSELGTSEWYEIICPSRTKEYKSAQEYLEKLGYKLIDKSTFRTADGNALIDFQKSERLAYGALDEATLKLLIQKSINYE